MSLRLPRLLFPRFSPLLRLRSPLLLLSDTSESIKSHVDWSMRNVTKQGNKATSSSQVTRYVCSAVLDQHVCWSCASFEKSSVGVFFFTLTLKRCITADAPSLLLFGSREMRRDTAGACHQPWTWMLVWKPNPDSLYIITYGRDRRRGAKLMPTFMVYDE